MEFELKVGLNGDIRNIKLVDIIEFGVINHKVLNKDRTFKRFHKKGYIKKPNGEKIEFFNINEIEKMQSSLGSSLLCQSLLLFDLKPSNLGYGVVICQAENIIFSKI